MYSEEFHVGVYWGMRSESHDVCVDRIAILLNSFGHIDPLFVQWCIPGESLEQSQTPARTDKESISAMLHHDPFMAVPDVELGYSFGLWSGGSEREAAGLTILCGSSADGLLNSCGVRLPSEGARVDRIVRSSVLSEVMRVASSPESVGEFRLR
jgi:hypothetical protein